ncbi:MAG TPA: hypothetical protein VLC98_04095 [Phnomibacter sp.]|nr:hypothetical protein [Phnomibacter sp.]
MALFNENNVENIRSSHTKAFTKVCYTNEEKIVMWLSGLIVCKSYKKTGALPTEQVMNGMCQLLKKMNMERGGGNRKLNRGW